jgi:hypothetical protein
MAAGGLELEGVVKARSSEERVAPNDACLPSDARHAPFSTEVISRVWTFSYTATSSSCERFRLDSKFLFRVKTRLTVELFRDYLSL